MANLKSRYRKFADGGAVTAEPAPISEPDLTADVTADREQSPLSAEQEQWIEDWNAPPLAKRWARDNVDILLNRNEQLQAMHHELVQHGFEEYTEPYFAEINRRMAAEPDDVGYYSSANSAIRVSPKAAVEEDEPEDLGRNRRLMSAPVSREPISFSDGRRYSEQKITLSPAQREAARVAGVSEKTYADNLRKMLEMKERGELQL
jgi:hypothetical protein